MSIINKVKVKNTEYDILDSNYVHTDNNYTTEEKTKLGTLQNYDDTEIKGDITNLQNNKANTSDLSTVATSGSYTDLSDKPTIPDVSNFITKDVNDLTNYYTKTETDNKIPDVSNFITNTVDDLVNYYKKSETYTQTEVNNLIGAISTMNLLVVQELPTQDISTTTIYLVPRTTAETNNVYDEYIYVSNNWEKIGSTDIDLSDYVTTTQLNTALADYTTTTDLTTLLNGKQNTIDNSHKLSSDLVDDTNNTNLFVTTSEKTTWNAKYDKPSGGIPSTDLASGVIPDLTNYIQTSSTSGLIKNDGTIDTTTYQAQLTAGTNITIDANNVISASGGSSIAEETKIYSLVMPNFEINVGSGSYRNLTTADKTAIKTLLQKIYDNGDDFFVLAICNSNYNQNILVNTEKKLKSKPLAMEFDGVIDYATYSNVIRVKLSIMLSWSGDTLNVTSGELMVSLNPYLRTNNTTSYTPTGNYHPATKKYVDDKLSTYTGYDATKTQVLKNINGTLTWVDE